MSVRSTYHSYNPQSQINYQCPICFIEDTSSNPQTVAHSGQGEKHPVHKDCVKAWVQRHPVCPTCATEINIKSLFSWKERCISKISHILEETLNSQTYPIIAGTFLFTPHTY